MAQKKSTFPLSFLFTFFILVFSLLCFFSSGYLDSEDGWLYASVARNIYYNHQITAAPNEYPEYNVHMNSTQGADGVWRAPGSLGYSLAMIPAVFFSDLVHRYYQTTPPIRFPLEHDWSFHFFASFTNFFFAAFLAVTLLLYAVELGFSRKQALIMALSTIFLTNLLPLSKYSFPHLMFTSFLVATFYLIKKFGTSQNIKYLFFATITFGITVISYNTTYLLTIIPLGLYLLLQETPSQRRLTLLIGGLSTVVAFIFIQPLFVSFFLTIIEISPKLLFEGVWGYLFSPGKSVFLYSPLLLLLLLFWSKINKSMAKELATFLCLTIMYLYVVGSATITKAGMLQPIWHGGMVWGPRYLAVLIPFWMIFVFHIVFQLKKKQINWIVVPLFILSLWTQIIGVSVSYLLQYIDLPYNYFIGKSEILVYDYASFIPRYSPLITLSKQFIKKVQDIPETVNNGKYQVRFFDGWDAPYQTSVGTYRGFRDKGFISFQTPQEGTYAFEMLLRNVPDDPTKGVASTIDVLLNEEPITSILLEPGEDRKLQIPIISRNSTDTNELTFIANYSEKLDAPQVIYLKELKINSTNVNLGSLDYPDMSNLGIKTSSQPYRYTGVEIQDKWVSWQMRARVNERTLDFWWIKNAYYWDRPKKLIWTILGINVAIFCLSSYTLLKMVRSLKS